MELTKEELEAIAWFLGEHWKEFSDGVEEFMSIWTLLNKSNF